MKREEIPRGVWKDWLAMLGNRLQSRNTRIDIAGPDAGRQMMAEMPLVGISYDPKERPSDLMEITVALQEPEGPSAEHVIQKPARIIAEVGDDGEVQALDIEDEERQRTFVYFSQEGVAPPA